MQHRAISSLLFLLPALASLPIAPFSTPARLPPPTSHRPPPTARLLARPPPTTHCSDELALIPDSVIFDPALQREKGVQCPKCAHKGAVLIQAKPTAADTKIKILFVCTNTECVHRFDE